MVHSAEDGSIPVITDDAEWMTIDTAPRDGTAIQARIPGHGDDNMIGFHYIGDCGSEEGGAAYGWTFVTDQEPPDDWTDGYCWAVNEAGNQSTLPTHWKPAKPIQHGYEASGEVSPNLKAKAQGEGG